MNISANDNSRCHAHYSGQTLQFLVGIVRQFDTRHVATARAFA